MTVTLDTTDSACDAGAKVEIDLPSSTQFVALVRMVVAAAAHAGDSLDVNRLDDLRLVTSEATTNAVEANLIGCPSQSLEQKRVHVSCVINPGVVTVEVADEGPGMDQDTTTLEMEAIDRWQEHGRGIPLIRHFSDRVDFNSRMIGASVRIEMRQSC